MSHNPPKQYICTELVDIQGVMFCKTWQELTSQPILPSLTSQQADDITLAILKVIFLAFGWFVLIKFVRTFK